MSAVNDTGGEGPLQPSIARLWTEQVPLPRTSVSCQPRGSHPKHLLEERTARVAATQPSSARPCAKGFEYLFSLGPDQDPVHSLA